MNENFGEFIKEMRKKKSLTQKEMAKLLNISDKAISKWEVGDSYPDISLLHPISDIFEISIDELMQCKIDEKKQENEITKKLILFNIASNLLLIIILIIFLLMSLIQVNSNDSSVMFGVKDYETFSVVVIVVSIIVSITFCTYNLLQFRKYERGNNNEEGNSI